MDLNELLKELERAKRNVIAMIECKDVICDFHSLSYRAQRVEELREQIKPFIS